MSWRQPEAEFNGLSCVEHELVMSNALLSKVIDNFSTIRYEKDLASLGVNIRFTTSLFQVIQALEPKPISMRKFGRTENQRGVD